MKKYLRKCVNGEEKLWIVFWLINILGGFIISVIPSLAIYKFIIGSVAEITINNPGILTFLKYLPLILLGIILVIFGLWYTVFALVSLWKCSWNTKHKIWGYLARGFILVSLIYTVFGGIIEK